MGGGKGGSDFNPKVRLIYDVIGLTKYILSLNRDGLTAKSVNSATPSCESLADTSVQIPMFLLEILVLVVVRLPTCSVHTSRSAMSSLVSLPVKA